MSIDLHVNVDPPVQIADLTVRARAELAKLIQFNPVPAIVIREIDQGCQRPVTINELYEGNFVLSYEGRKEQVLVDVFPHDDELDIPAFISFDVSSARTASEYALALAAAIAVASAKCGPLEDGGRFWSDELVSEPLDLLSSLALKQVPGSFDEGCRLLVGDRIA